jgi:nitroreductase
MDLVNIVKGRRSIRAFRPDRVPRKAIEKILETALRAPSAINLQPWDLTVVMDEERERLSRVLLKAFREKRISCSPGNVKPLPSSVTARGRESFEGMKPILDGMGLEFESFINEGSCRFYGAPTAIIACIDSAFSRARLVDIGLCLGYLLLAAHDAGLWTCPVGLIAAYADEVKECLNISDEKSVVIGIALGYPDWDNPINNFTSSRESVAKMIRWVD